MSFTTKISANGTRNNPYQMGEKFNASGSGFTSGEVEFTFELLDTKKNQEAYKLIKENNKIMADDYLEKAEEENKELMLAKFYAKAVKLEKEPYSINEMTLFEINGFYW